MPNTNVYNRLAIRRQGARGLSMVARDRSHSAVNFSAPVSVGTAGGKGMLEIQLVYGFQGKGVKMRH